MPEPIAISKRPSQFFRNNASVRSWSASAPSLTTVTDILQPLAKGGRGRHTLLPVESAAALNATLYDKLTFNFVRDIAPVAVYRTPTRDHDDQSVHLGRTVMPYRVSITAVTLASALCLTGPIKTAQRYIPKNVFFLREKVLIYDAPESATFPRKGSWSSPPSMTKYQPRR
jgi:hypothetical protein